MDVTETLRQLKIEKQRLDDAIAVLEEFLTASGRQPAQITKRRGRKSMPPEELQAVSERMTLYWKKRRQGQPD